MNKIIVKGNIVTRVIKFKDLSRISRIGIKFKDFKDFLKDVATLSCSTLNPEQSETMKSLGSK